VVEEVAGVVQLQAVEGVEVVEVVEDLPKLGRECARRRRALEGPAPQVAERTGERTLGAGEEDRECPLGSTARSPFFLYYRAVRLPRIDARLG
jgi:hypothetical protein